MKKLIFILIAAFSITSCHPYNEPTYDEPEIHFVKVSKPQIPTIPTDSTSFNVMGVCH